jgi:methyltransferase (TIGR00027 family)
MSGPPIRNVSDTARWVAVYRARETERPDALFSDPHARRLAGERGEQIVRAMPFADASGWAFTARTILFDRFIAAAIAGGATLVVNLGAGLDARPYRMDLPASLRWVEVDLPGILDYKASVLAEERPRCRLERIPVDLSDAAARRALFDDLTREPGRGLAIAEGLLLYFSAEDAAALAREMHDARVFEWWVIDLMSPATLMMLQDQIGTLVQDAGAPYRFAPPEGLAFFEPLGWTPAGVESHLATAIDLKRWPFPLPFGPLPPDTEETRKSTLWSGTCLLQRRS